MPSLRDEVQVKITTKADTKGVDKAKKSIRGFSQEATEASKLFAGAMLGAGVAAGAMGVKAINLASDVEEMTSKFNVVFSETGPQVRQELEAFGAEVGRSRFQLMGMASDLGDTLKPMGFTEQAAASTSTELVKLATDLSSFNNISMDEALRRLQGTLIGAHENALKFGVVINENTLKAEMAKQGWDDLTGAELEAAKVQARINLLMQGTTDAQGDAARTSEGFANKTRALKAQLEDIGIAIGQQLLPHVTELVSAISQNLEPTLTAIFNFFKENEFVLYAISGAIIGALVPAIWSAVTAFGSLLVTLAPFLIIGAAIALALYALKTAWETNFLGIRDIVASVKDWFVNTAIPAVTGAIDSVKLFIENLRTRWQESWAAIQLAVQVVTDFFNTYIVPIIKGAFKVIEVALLLLYNSFNFQWQAIKWVVQTAVDAFVNSALYGALQTAFDFVRGILWTLSNNFKEQWELISSIVQGAVDWVVNTALPPLQREFERVKGWVEELKNNWDLFWDGMAYTVESTVDSILSFVKRMADGVKSFVNGLISSANSVGSKIPGYKEIPQLASGVRNFGGGMALVGERGPELVTLPKGSNVYSNRETQAMAGGGITINNYIQDSIDVERVTRDIVFRASTL